MDIQRIGEIMNVIKKMSTSALENKEKGAITIVETLVVLGVGIAVLMFYAVQQGDRLEIDGARAAGRDIANYTRAASVWIAASPPSTPGNYGIADLQDCADPAGARFLPCAFTEDITIRYATNAAGEPVNFADLVIEVALPPEGPTGSIDFGVFRQGDDANDDGFPDPRPDLAAIALQHASEETPSGVFGYFSLQFAREDLTGLVTDPNDPSFDLAEVENVARIQATVGAHAAASPFLRVDGSNQMQNGITFVNGVQLSMSADRLEIDAPGGIDFETDVRVETLAATEVSVSDELQVIAANGVTGAGFDRLDQSADIVRIDGDVVRLSQDIDLNRLAIGQNLADITSNAANTASLQNDVQDNRTRIGSNAREISDVSIEVRQLISSIEDPPPPPPPPPPEISICAPLWATVRNEMSGLGYTSYSNCGTSCRPHLYPCPEAHGTRVCLGAYSANPVAYESRDVSTLNCRSHTASFYTSQYCRKDFSGNPCK